MRIMVDIDVLWRCTGVVHLPETSFAEKSILKKMDLPSFEETVLMYERYTGLIGFLCW